MRVFGLTTGADTGGINVRIAQAFRRHTDWDVRAMVATVNYIDYPVDVPHDRPTLYRLYRSADVVHIHNTTHAHYRYDAGQGKPTVLMHHGTEFRERHAAIAAEAERIRAVQVASTLDLAILEPNVEWLPAPYNLAELRAIRDAEYQPGPVIRIAHAPTNRAIKGSDAFDAAIARLSGSGVAVEPVVIEGRTWAEALRMKATADVLWDQPTLGYGCNAIEAWGMGIPVIAGVADRTVRAAMLAKWGRLPFMEASEDTLGDAIRALATDPALRRHFAEIGRSHVERWHDEAVVVEQLKAVYERAPRTRPGRYSQLRRAA